MRISNKRTHRGLAFLALVVFGIACWQASNGSNSAVHAAAISASRAALDEATARFKADPTPETAAQLQEARKHFATAAAADPAYARSGVVQTTPPSALLQDLPGGRAASARPVLRACADRPLCQADVISGPLKGRVGVPPAATGGRRLRCAGSGRGRPLGPHRSL